MSSSISPEDLRPRVDAWVCAKCRRDIQKGDRITWSLISHGKERDPMDFMRQGMMISDEHEYVHIDCTDPKLVKGVKL